MVLIVLFCFIGPLIYHTNQTTTDLATYLCRPGGKHLLGCDEVGYDQLGRLMIGGQVSIEVGLAAAVVSVLIGTLSTAPSPATSGERLTRFSCGSSMRACPSRTSW